MNFSAYYICKKKNDPPRAAKILIKKNVYTVYTKTGGKKI